MKKLLITGWIPEDIIKDYDKTFSITMPDQKKNNFSLEEVMEMLPEYDGLFTLSAFPFRKNLIDL